jgi:hypothetical protein
MMILQVLQGFDQTTAGHRHTAIIVPWHRDAARVFGPGLRIRLWISALDAERISATERRSPPVQLLTYLVTPLTGSRDVPVGADDAGHHPPKGA